jgi:riboflavin kinase/FMN adenylyltransferase
MKIARGIEEAEATDFGPSVLTIGKFDGVHAAHSYLLRQVVTLARERKLYASALTFDPHPVCVLAPDRAPKPLTSLEDRCARMRLLGIERLFILPFTRDVAQLSPEDFVERFVHDAMDARVVLVGENFRFGHRAAGDPGILAQLGERYGFETRVVSAVKFRGLIVSTSEIRSRIEAGEVSLAARLLERPYALSGDVVPGRGVGSKQTVPTLNLRTEAQVLPRNGVYITRTEDPDTGRRWNSITNIGLRPTFDGDTLTIETFLLDPLSGANPARIRVGFLHRVRDERKFESPEALKRQILRDASKAQAFFRRLSRWIPGLK